MTTELVKIDPKEFGLEENQVQTIEQAFMPKIIERDGYVKVYEQLITKELTPSLCSEAAELRRKLVKTRTGIAEIHKTQKAFFLAAGRFVDAWKNKETAPIEQMEEKLSEIEKHFEKIEAERIAKLETERTKEISTYSDVFPAGLGRMDESVYTNYLAGLKLAYEARIKAEQEAEDERLAFEMLVKQRNEREIILLKIDGVKFNDNMTFTLKDLENEDYSCMIDAKEILDCDEDKFNGYLSEFKTTESNNAKYLENQRIENEKLKTELEKQRKENERIQKEKDAENARLAKELQDKKNAEAAANAEAERKEKERLDAALKAAKAPDKVKLKTVINSLSIDLPKCSTKEADFIANEITSKFASFKIWAEKLIETI